MSPKNVQIAFTTFGVIWVGGLGYLMYRSPEYFAKRQAAWRLRTFATSREIEFMRRVGIVEMTLAGLSAISEIVMLIFGFKWY